MKETFQSNSPEETQQIAENFIKFLNPGDVLALQGNLGTGKTEFVKGLAKGVKALNRVSSPTFIIYKKYETSTPKFNSFFHFDLYRLSKPEDLDEIGFEEILKTNKSLFAIEWPERAITQLPENTIWIKFASGQQPDERTINIWKKN